MPLPAPMSTKITHHIPWHWNVKCQIHKNWPNFGIRFKHCFFFNLKQISKYLNCLSMVEISSLTSMFILCHSKKNQFLVPGGLGWVGLGWVGLGWRGEGGGGGGGGGAWWGSHYVTLTTGRGGVCCPKRSLFQLHFCSKGLFGGQFP